MSDGAERSASSLDLLAGMRVLVVDDDADQVTLVRDVLTRADAAVECATNVGEAMGRFAEVRPDVIVNDLTMPETDGFQFIRMVRARAAEDVGSTPHTRALLYGFQTYLAKPVGPEVLVGVVGELVRARA